MQPRSLPACLHTPYEAKFEHRQGSLSRGGQYLSWRHGDAWRSFSSAAWLHFWSVSLVASGGKAKETYSGTVCILPTNASLSWHVLYVHIMVHHFEELRRDDNVTHYWRTACLFCLLYYSENYLNKNLIKMWSCRFDMQQGKWRSYLQHAGKWPICSVLFFKALWFHGAENTGTCVSFHYKRHRRLFPNHLM